MSTTESGRINQDMGKLEGKVAVITGATAGMGLATAGLFRDEGAHVYVTGRDQQRLDAALADVGAGVTGVRADSADLADLDHLFGVVERDHGRLDVIYASAGIGHWAPLTETTPESFDAVFAVNARGTFFTVQKALGLMPVGGAVILTGSSGTNLGLANLSAYNASKAAVRSYTASWANDLAGRRIRVNMITPGGIDNAQTLAYPTEWRDRVAQAAPLRRWGQADEVARVALFLASDDSSYVNAAELLVDGGTVATRNF